MATPARSKSPYETSWFPCKFTFDWLTPLLCKGFFKPLEPHQIPQLPANETAEVLFQRFDEAWQKHKGGKFALFIALNRVFGASFWFGGFLSFLVSVLAVVQPILVRFIILYYNDPEVWKVYVLVASLFLSALLANICQIHYGRFAMLTSLRLQSAITSKIYHKALTLSTAARSSISSGEIVNLLSVDTFKIGEVVQFYHWGITGLVQVVLCLGLLFYLLGWVTFVGIGVMILLFPLQTIILKLFSQGRTKVLKYTDLRIKTINEILQGVRIIKFFSWEDSYGKRVRDFRAKEVKNFGKLAFIDSLLNAIMMGSPLAVSIVTFIVYAAVNNWQLKADVIFPALGFINVLRFPLAFLPFVITMVIQAFISLNRLQRFFMQEDRTDLQTGNNPDTPVVIENGNFSWAPPSLPEPKKKPSSTGCCGSSKSTKEPENENNGEKKEEKEPGKLSDIQLHVKRGDLCLVVGRVGSGKSSLLQAIVAEMKKDSGTIEVTGSVAYCSQQPWIQNASLRDNVTFGKEFEQQKYDKILEVCALKKDLEILPQADLTEIGEKGINLSGGQRQRTSLARAVYSDRDIYLLDDITSAVDAHVGRHIFEKCIMEYLQNKTRIFVTHQLQYLSYAHKIVVVGSGRIMEQGTYDELSKREGGELKRLLDEYNLHKHEVEEKQPEQDKEKTSLTEKKEESPENSGKLIQDEELARGVVSLRVLWNYTWKMGGPIIILLILSFFLLAQAGLVLTDWWLAQWSANSFASFTYNHYLGIYIGLGAVAIFAIFFRDFCLQSFALLAAFRLHVAMFKRVIRAPAPFFDVTPLGSILARFSKDQENADSTFIAGVSQTINAIFQVLGALAVMIYASYWFIIPMVPVILVYLAVVTIYRNNARELKRLDAVKRSPLFAHFAESMVGIPTIRSYNADERFKSITREKIDDHVSVLFIEYQSRIWMMGRLDFLGSLLVAASGFLILAMKNQISVSVAGLGFTYAIQITAFLSWAVLQFSKAEANLSCIERILHYSNSIPNEAPAIIHEKRPTSNWPDRGAISFNSFSMRYRPNLPLVLKNLTIDIKPGEKIGIVGRTGGGKSSMMLALFRFVEAAEGNISIDGIDISTIGLQDLRRKIAIIPQEPVLFSGTVRSNLDPFNEYSDQHLWSCLEKAHILKDIEALPSKLDNIVTENGDNFSVGQRQLLCLARALTKQTKILIMDEVTANLDYECDALIQRTVRDEFASCTRLTIAHRLNTIVDSDRILVLDKGSLAEFDTPLALISNEHSIFTSMVNETGSANAALLKRIVQDREKLSTQQLVELQLEMGHCKDEQQKQDEHQIQKQGEQQIQKQGEQLTHSQDKQTQKQDEQQIHLQDEQQTHLQDEQIHPQIREQEGLELEVSEHKNADNENGRSE